MRLPHSRRGVSAEGFRNIFFYFKEKKMMRRPAEGVFFFRPQLFRHIGPHTNGFISTFIIFLIQNFLQNRLLLFCFFFYFPNLLPTLIRSLGFPVGGFTGVHGGPRGSTGVHDRRKNVVGPRRKRLLTLYWLFSSSSSSSAGARSSASTASGFYGW